MAGPLDEKPKLPYFDWGACPFEGCTYREWEANAPVIAYKSRSTKAEVAFHVQKGERVDGVTGVVITYQFGISKVLKPTTLGYTPKGSKPELNLKPGELLYTLHYAGEGWDLFWYKGKVYTDQINANDPLSGPPPPGLIVQVLTSPKIVWWVKIKNKSGAVGWTTETERFDHMDKFE
jgi:hypothetical protein